MADRRVLTLREVANYLSVHPNTIYRMAQKAEIPAFKVGRDWRFNLESLDHWRLTQEKCPQQSLDPSREILDIVFWYQQEGVQAAVSQNEIAVFLGGSASSLNAALARLVKTGMLALSEDGSGYRLTRTGHILAQGSVSASTRPAGHASVFDLDVRELPNLHSRHISQNEGDPDPWIR